MIVALILLKVTLTALCALGAVRLARHSRAAIRHVVLASAFAVLLLLPVASLVSPAVRVTVPVAPAYIPEPVANVLEAEPLAIGDVIDAPPGNVAATTDAGPARKPLPWATVAMVAWLAGLAAAMTPLAVGVWQMRSLRRTALPWLDGQPLVDQLARGAGIRRRVGLLQHEAISGPMTCGVFKPVVLLPIDAATWSADELSAALVHEIEHVRRFDWLTQAATRAISAGYWFHPLVWAARRQLMLEAERACDDAVLRSSEATAYADQLVLLARRLSAAGNQPLLAMANRADLATRVVAVLDGRQARGRAGARFVLLGSVVAAALIVAVSPLRIVAAARLAAGQSAADGPKFDVVSIKPCPDDTPPPGAGSGARSSQGGFPNVGPGRFTIECGTVERMISTAYVINGEPLLNNSPRIGDVSWWKGGPSWLRTDKFTVEATAQGVTDRKVMLGPMLRALLEDRFKLKMHRDQAEVPMYDLVVAKAGLKLKPEACKEYSDDDPRPTTQDEARAQVAAVAAGTTIPTCGNMTMLGDAGTSRWIIGGETIPAFAGTLSTWMDRRVIDKTGLDATPKYNIRLSFRRDEHVPGADKRFGPPPAAPEGEGPNIFASLEQQLGLHLEPSKGMQGFLVIDHVERPSADAPVPSRATGAGSLGRALVDAAQSALVAVAPQTPATPAPSASTPLPVQQFDAISIKPCDGEPQLQPAPQGRRGTIGLPVVSPGRITLDCGTVERLIRLAYITYGEPLLHNNAVMLPERTSGPPRPGDYDDDWWKGAPGWIRTERFGIEATAQGVTDRAVLLGPMLRGLLESRFKLRLHRDQADAPLYRMVVAKDGFKGNTEPCSAYDPNQIPRTAEESQAWSKARWEGTYRECGIVSTLMGWAIGGQTMEDVATKVMPLLHVDRFVINDTGLDGKYNMRITMRPTTPGEEVNVFAAIEKQLGLKLEPTRGPRGFLAIDRVEHPSPDLGVPLRAAGPGR